jgi:flagellar biosynthesis GTPase FlhF
VCSVNRSVSGVGVLDHDAREHSADRAEPRRRDAVHSVLFFFFVLRLGVFVLFSAFGPVKKKNEKKKTKTKKRKKEEKKRSTKKKRKKERSTKKRSAKKRKQERSAKKRNKERSTKEKEKRSEAQKSEAQKKKKKGAKHRRKRAKHRRKKQKRKKEKRKKDDEDERAVEAELDHVVDFVWRFDRDVLYARDDTQAFVRPGVRARAGNFDHVLDRDPRCAVGQTTHRAVRIIKKIIKK